MRRLPVLGTLVLFLAMAGSAAADPVGVAGFRDSGRLTFVTTQSGDTFTRTAVSASEVFHVNAASYAVTNPGAYFKTYGHVPGYVFDGGYGPLFARWNRAGFVPAVDSGGAAPAGAFDGSSSAVTPEPASLLLLGSGLALAGLRARRKAASRA